MKLFISLVIFFVLFLKCAQPIFGVASNDTNGPLIDSGMGYAVGAPVKKTADKILEEYINIFFGFGSLLENEEPITVPSPTTVGPTGGSGNGSPTPTPYLGPIGSTTEEGNFADRVTQIIHQNCRTNNVNGVIRSSNANCTYSLVGTMNNDGIDEIRYSALNYQYVQCVGCARAMAKARGRPYYGTGNAKQHANQSVPNYTYYPNEQGTRAYMTPGSLFIIRDSAYGHIGYVTEVYRDSGGLVDSFKGFECNWGANGYVQHGITVNGNVKIWSISAITGWQKPNTL